VEFNVAVYRGIVARRAAATLDAQPR
jgi:hypothetical protein